MPTKKSSPKKARKSPGKSKSRSRSRSASRSRKPTSRSRSRSASRRSVKTVTLEERSVKKVGRPLKVNPSPTRVTVVKDVKTVQEEKVGPTRASQRIIEKTYQVTKNTVAEKGDDTKRVKVVETTNEGGLGYAGMIMVIIMLFITYLLAFSCTKESCHVFKIPKIPRDWKAYLNLEVAACFLAFYALITVLALIPVGSLVQGPPLRDGRRLTYRCNAWVTLLAFAALFGYVMTQTRFPFNMLYVHTHLLQFATTSAIFSIFLSLALFVMGRHAPMSERSPASDGTFWNDFCMGRVLHPRIGDLDVKHILFRSAFMAWITIDWLYLLHGFKKHHTVEPTMALVVLCHTLYPLFCLKNEATWFSSNDFMKEGAGFMFCWASASFTPFICSLQTRFLHLYPKEGVSNPYILAALFVFNAFGLVFFIGSNWQKAEFRRNPYNPELAHLSSIPTATGRRLLCSGWWGIVRRPNYLGDLVMALAWSLACGVSYFVPYLYPLYLVILLTGRVISDEKSCQQRYGDAWNKYTEVVRYRFIPYVF